GTGPAQPCQCTGREADETGLMFYRARYFNPNWGRFVSADPAGFAGGINPYVYAWNNPATYGDPSGRGLLLASEGDPYYPGDVGGMSLADDAAAVAISAAEAGLE